MMIKKKNTAVDRETLAFITEALIQRDQRLPQEALNEMFLALDAIERKYDLIEPLSDKVLEVIEERRKSIERGEGIPMEELEIFKMFKNRDRDAAGKDAFVDCGGKGPTSTWQWNRAHSRTGCLRCLTKPSSTFRRWRISKRSDFSAHSNSLFVRVNHLLRMQWRVANFRSMSKALHHIGGGPDAESRMYEAGRFVGEGRILMGCRQLSQRHDRLELM